MPARRKPGFLLTISQAADHAGVDRHRVAEWAKLPGFPLATLPGLDLPRIPRTLFEQWLEHHAPEQVPA